MQAGETNLPGFGPTASGYLWTVAGTLALVLCVAGGLVLRASLDNPDGIPPLKITGNSPLDRKMWFVRRALLEGKGQDVVAAGSSMTMTDLSSDEFMQDLPASHLLNIAFWGMKISDTRRFLQNLLKVVHPKTVIMATNVMDFYPEELPMDVTDDDLTEFLSDPGSLSFDFLMLRKFSFSYNANDYLRRPAAKKGDRSFYLSLDFDRGGAVPLEISYPNVDHDRWTVKPDYRRASDKQYQALNQFAADLHARGIEMIVVQAPMRPISVDDGTFASLSEHWQRVTGMLDKNGARFIPTQNELHLDDSYFCDYTHLNSKGTAVFTRYVTQHLHADQPVP